MNLILEFIHEHILAIEGVKPHIYGKKETRPFRKMGHITVMNESLEEAKKMEKYKPSKQTQKKSSNKCHSATKGGDFS